MNHNLLVIVQLVNLYRLNSQLKRRERISKRCNTFSIANGGAKKLGIPCQAFLLYNKKEGLSTNHDECNGVDMRLIHIEARRNRRNFNFVFEDIVRKLGGFEYVLL